MVFLSGSGRKVSRLPAAVVKGWPHICPHTSLLVLVVRLAPEVYANLLSNYALDK